MPIEQYTYWSVTINNPEENDYLIVRNPNSKYIRECVWTPEVGEEGTEHIQAWIRLQRNQSLSFVKKLYPRAHLKPTDKDQYNENAHQYAQKNDETTAGNHHIVLNDPLPAVDTILYKVLTEAATHTINYKWKVGYDNYKENYFLHSDLCSLKDLNTDDVERDMVMEKPGLEKIFISPTYEKIKLKFWRQILYRIFKSINEDARSASRNSEATYEEVERETQGGDSEDNEDSGSTEDEGLSESGSSCGSEEDAVSDY